MTRHPRLIGWCGALLIAMVLAPSHATPCTCMGEWPKFKKAMGYASLVITAEVVSQGHLKRERLYPEHDVAYLDVRIVKVLKGKESRATVRVWDPMFGTSCSLDLGQIKTGSFAAFAVSRTGRTRGELFEALQINPASDDYLLQGCGEYYRVLESLTAAQKFQR